MKDPFIITLGTVYKDFAHYQNQGGALMFDFARPFIYPTADTPIVLDFDGAYGYMERDLRDFASRLASAYGFDYFYRRLHVVCEDEECLCTRFLKYFREAASRTPEKYKIIRAKHGYKLRRRWFT